MILLGVLPIQPQLSWSDEPPRVDATENRERRESAAAFREIKGNGYVAMTFNVGTTPRLRHDDGPDDGYTSVEAEISDRWYGNGLAWRRAMSVPHAGTISSEKESHFISSQESARGLEPQGISLARRLHRSKNPEQELTAVPGTLQSRQWYDITIQAIGGRIDVAIGDQHVLSYTDSAPLISVPCGLGVIANSGAVLYDDAVLTPLSPVAGVSGTPQSQVATSWP